MSQPIENHGIVGDLHTVALVTMDGAIDFMCFPRFDSPTVFAALLDDDNGGVFRVAPAFDRARSKQLYLPDSNVLLTRFLSEEGVAELSDFMPVEGDGAQARDGARMHDLVRRVKTVRGQVRYRLTCAPRFDYGRARHVVHRHDGAVIFESQGADRTALRLRVPVPYDVVDGAVVADFELAAGETAAFVLEQASADRASPSAGASYVGDAFKRTNSFWRGWVGRSSYRGRWREMVNRSALVLKLLTSCEYGSIVAAPTFGLPELIGGTRNWDYRYTWVRDSSFTLYALIRLGYTEEAAAFMGWIGQRCRAASAAVPLQIMYGIDGRTDLAEEELAHLGGYQGSRPVRIGNGACAQLQLDIYGELLDAVYLYDKHGAPISHDLWGDLVRLVAWVCDNWQRADEGIWEVRGGRQHFLYSRLMCWVAVDRAVRLATKRSLPCPLAVWRRVRDGIYREIHTEFWNADLGAFVQTRGARALDASALLMPLVRFISPVDPRWLSTLRAIERELVSDSLVFRYRIGDEPLDGLEGREGTFSMCSFWYVECLARSGDLDKARFYFEKTLGYANHLGLYSEELGPAGEHLGNFPQAFTHLGLISAAYYLDRALSTRR